MLQRFEEFFPLLPLDSCPHARTPAPAARALFHRQEGSSAVWRAADFNTTGRYIINYSQFAQSVCNCQNITFAESTDLIHWTNGTMASTSFRATFHAVPSVTPSRTRVVVV